MKNSVQGVMHHCHSDNYHLSASSCPLHRSMLIVFGFAWSRCTGVPQILYIMNLNSIIFSLCTGKNLQPCL